MVIMDFSDIMALGNTAAFITFVLIYFLNIKLSLKEMDMDYEVKKRLALILAIFTTPWIFLFPSIVFYK